MTLILAEIPTLRVVTVPQIATVSFDFHSAKTEKTKKCSSFSNHAVI